MANSIHPLTTQKLHAFARRRRLLLVVRGVCAAGATFLGAMTLVALLDRFIVMPDWLRLVLSIAAYAAVLLVVAWTSLRPLVRRSNREELARLFGNAFPELGDDMVSAVELGDPASDARWDSPAFRAVLQQSVAHRVGPARVSLLLPWRLIAGWGLAAVALVAIVAVLDAIPNMHFGQLMARAADPTINLARVSDTTIRLLQPEHPDKPVPRGDPFPILVEIKGHDSQSSRMAVTLHIRRGNESDTEVKMDPATQPGQFAASLDVGPDPLSFRAEAGDAATRWYTINARPRPEAMKFDKTYEYPVYAKMPAKHAVEENGDLAAIEGSRATVVIETDQPVKEARLRIEAGDKPQDIVMQAAQPDSKHWSATIPLTTAGSYQVHLVAADTGFENKFSPQYEIRPIPDLRPSAEITRPTADARAAPDATLDLRGSAHDDLALAGVVQMIRVNQGPWKEVPLVKDGNAEAVIQRPWSLRELNLHDGDEVTTKLVATDRKGNVGESEPVRIAIGPAAPPPGSEDKTSAQKITDGAKTLAAAADQIRDQTAATAKDAGKDTKANAAKASALAEKQEALDRGVAELKDELKRDANQQDLMTPDGRELARDNDDAAAMLKQPTPSAGDNLQQAEKQTDAAAQKKSLQSAADDQKKLADTLHELAKHYEATQAGKPEETRAALRQSESTTGVKSDLDTQYGQLKKLADMAQMSPDELKPALEAELPKNPAMQGELGQIAKNAVDEAKSDLDRATADEKQAADNLAKSDPPPDTAAEAAKQSQIADSVQRAADNQDRAAQDAQRLGQPDAAKALQDSAAQTQQIAKSNIPAAQQAIASKSSDEAQAAAKKAAAAIGEQSKKLDAISKNNSPAPSSPNGQQPASPSQTGDKNNPPSSDQSPNSKQNQSSASPKGQSDSSSAQPPDSKSNQNNSPSSPSDTAAAQPAAAASKWMAAALDHLDQAAQKSAAGGTPQPQQGQQAQPSQQSPSQASGENPSAPSQQSPDQSAAQANNSSANQGENPATPQSSEQSENGAAQSNQQGNAAANAANAAASQNALAAATSAMRTAADAQAQAVRDNRMNDGASSSQTSNTDTASTTGPPGASASHNPGDKTSANASHDDGAVPNDPAGPSKGTWGKLSPQAARDLMESHRENIPEEYRQQVEAYFRAIAEKTNKPSQP